MPDCELSTFEYPMLDETLQKAIQQTHELIRRTSKDMKVHDDLNSHLRKLLEAQADRANLVRLDSPSLRAKEAGG